MNYHTNSTKRMNVKSKSNNKNIDFRIQVNLEVRIWTISEGIQFDLYI